MIIPVYKNIVHSIGVKIKDKSNNIHQQLPDVLVLVSQFAKRENKKVNNAKRNRKKIGVKIKMLAFALLCALPLADRLLNQSVDFSVNQAAKSE